MKLIKIRKDRQCDYCFDNLKKGDSVYFEEGKFAKCDESDKQNGIEYYKNYRCITCHNETNMYNVVFDENGDFTTNRF